MRVLLVDDGSVMAKAARLMLESEGYKCDRVDLRVDDLEIGKLHDYDLIVLDLMLQSMEFYEVIRWLHAAKVPAPICILSDLSELNRMVNGQGSATGDYFIKPFDKAELTAQIDSVLRLSRGNLDEAIDTGNQPINVDTDIEEVNSLPPNRAGKEFGILEYGLLLALVAGGVIIASEFLITTVQ